MNDVVERSERNDEIKVLSVVTTYAVFFSIVRFTDFQTVILFNLGPVKDSADLLVMFSERG